jgi:hypothetical protein
VSPADDYHDRMLSSYGDDFYGDADEDEDEDEDDTSEDSE